MAKDFLDKLIKDRDSKIKEFATQLKNSKKKESFNHLEIFFEEIVDMNERIDFLKNDLPKLIEKPMDELDITYQKLREAGRKKAYKPKSIR